MADFVTKKDGTKVSFDVEKIKSGIMGAALESGLSDEESRNVSEEVSSMVVRSLEGSEEVSTAEVRDKILAELDVSHPAVAESWKRYEESKVE